MINLNTENFGLMLAIRSGLLICSSIIWKLVRYYCALLSPRLLRCLGMRMCAPQMLIWRMRMMCALWPLLLREFPSINRKSSSWKRAAGGRGGGGRGRGRGRVSGEGDPEEQQLRRKGRNRAPSLKAMEARASTAVAGRGRGQYQFNLSQCACELYSVQCHAKPAYVALLGYVFP